MAGNGNFAGRNAFSASRSSTIESLPPENRRTGRSNSAATSRMMWIASDSSASRCVSSYGMREPGIVGGWGETRFARLPLGGFTRPLDSRRVPDDPYAPFAEHGIHRISIPTPFAVGRVNLYLIEDDPLTLVDAGPNSGTSLEGLRRQLAGPGGPIGGIERGGST